MAPSWRKLFGGDQAPPILPTPEVNEVETLRSSLKATIGRLNAASGRLSGAVVVQVRRIEDVLRELIDHADRSPDNHLGALEMVSLEAAVTDYLPTSVDTFLALPPEFVENHKSASGRTPEEELLEQLILLEHGVRELAQAVYSGDAQRLNTQGRFLQTKFARSDLDLA